MAATKRYTFQGCTLDGTQRAAEDASYSPDLQTLSLRNAGTLTQEMLEVMQKRPGFGLTLLDPSLVTSPQQIGSGLDMETVGLYWRAHENLGGLSSTWKSAVVSNGLILPVSISAQAGGIARLQTRVIPLFSSGSAVTWGTSSFTPDIADRAYRMTKITIGGTDYTYLNSLQVDYRYNIQYLPPDGLEPSEAYWDDQLLSGQASLLDLAAATGARLEDSAAETVVCVFDDQKGAGSTLTVNLGTCRTMWDLSGAAAVVRFEQINN